MLSIRLERAKRQREAVEAISRLGGSVYYHYRVEDATHEMYFDATAETAWTGPEWMRSVFGIDFLVDAVAVIITDRRQVPYLPDLPALEFVHVNPESGCIDNDMRFLCASPRLRRLSIDQTPISDKGLAYLNQVPDLQALDLILFAVTDAGCKHLASLRHLSRLSLLNASISDRGCADIARLSNLESLEIHCARNGDKGLEQLGRLRNLRSLCLERTAVTDEGIKHLRGLSKLRKLVLASTAITDASLRRLASLTQLRVLDVKQTHVARQGLMSLRVLPSLRAATYIERHSVNFWGNGPMSMRYRWIRNAMMGKGVVPDVDYFADRGEIFVEASDDIAQIDKHPEAEAIRVIGVALDSHAMKAISACRHMKYLALHAAQIDDASLTKLRGLSELECLVLDDTEVTDSGIQAIGKLSGLKELYLWASPRITDVGLQHLAGLSRLKILSLAGCTIRGPGLAHLKCLNSLRGLDLQQAILTSEFLRQVRDLKQVKLLSLAGCDIQPEILDDLRRLASCEKVLLGQGADRDLDYVKLLQKSLPKEVFDLGFDAGSPDAKEPLFKTRGPL